MVVELAGFFIVSFFLAIAPGPSVIYVVAYSLRYGATEGVISALGVSAGSAVSIGIAAFGISSLIAIYPNTMGIIQVVGGVYILYLAMQLWPDRSASNIVDRNVKNASRSTLFRNGFITSVLNPKDILFYVSFIPTFIAVDTLGDSYTTWFLILAFSYAFIGFSTKCLFALFSGGAKNMLESGNTNIINYVSSIMLFLLGVFLVGQSLVDWPL